jgi:lipoyl(octanoyl) transferase
MTTITLPRINVVPYGVFKAETNMAIDRHLLALPGTHLRFYGWERPTLSFGRIRQGLSDIDPAVCRQYGIGGVKRLSGGKTILHQYELTYSLAADTDRFPPELIDTYRLISQALAEGLQAFGLSPELKRVRAPTTATSICFKEISAYELTVRGRKLVGSAQYRRRGRFFQHGAILLDADWRLWKQVWRLPAESRALEDRITTLKRELGHIPPVASLVETLTAAFGRFFNGELVRLTLSDDDHRVIGDLARAYHWPDFPSD